MPFIDLHNSILFIAMPVAIESISASTATFMVGSSAQLQCGASGRPLPSVTWLKNNVAITSGNNTSISQAISDQKSKIKSNLTISSLNIGDDGIYTCFLQGATRNQTTTMNISKLKRINN